MLVEADHVSRKLDPVPGRTCTAQVEHQRAVGGAVRGPLGFVIRRRDVFGFCDDRLTVEDHREILGLAAGELHAVAPGFLDGLPLVRCRCVVQYRADPHAVVLPRGERNRGFHVAGTLGQEILLVDALFDPDRVAGLGLVHGRLDRLEGQRSVPGFLSTALGSLRATKICAAKAPDAASAASTAVPARIARKEKCLAVVFIDQLL